MKHLKVSAECLARRKAAITVACGEEKENSDDNDDNYDMVPRPLGSLHAFFQMDSAWAMFTLEQAAHTKTPDCSDHCVLLPPTLGSSMNG